MAETLSKLRSDLEKRIREIEPLIEEHARLRQALEALKVVGGPRPGDRAPSASRRACHRREGPPRPAARVWCSRAAGSQARA